MVVRKNRGRGRKVSTAVTACVAVLVLPASAVAAPGDLDTAFGGGDGVAIADLGDPSVAFAMALQQDGKIVTAGVVRTGGGNTAVTRFNADGSPDTAFGGGAGIATADLGGADQANGVAVQPDGKIVTAGYVNGGSETVVARFNADGTPDTTFGGGDGFAVTEGGLGRAEALALQADGKIVTAGWNQEGTVLARFNPDGGLDTAFGGGDGSVIADLSTGFDLALGVALQADGKIVTAGAATDDGETAVARFNTDGSLDASFGGGDGFVTANLGGFDQAEGVVVQADGKIVTAGHAGSDATVARFTADGSLDPLFGGGDGYTVTDTGAYNAAYGVALQADGKIVTAGQSGFDTAVVRYNTDGSPDASFGGDGTVTHSVGDAGWADAVAVQEDGRILTTGFANSSTAVARYTTAQPAADLAVSLTATGSLANGVGVSATVTNNGPDPAAHVVTTTQLPAATSSVTGLPTACTWNPTNRQVTCTAGTLAAGIATTYTYRAHMNVLAFGPLPITITRTTSTPQDPNPANDQASRTCTATTGLIITC
ncbi:calcium-binding protein [Streptomyces sp. NPDC056254]|uniref:calcium-binding protein n=1 Tax=Streptomyces sp. NPDC056254 TaxID=3345763 RepID=UPI0035DD3C6D